MEALYGFTKPFYYIYSQRDYQYFNIQFNLKVRENRTKHNSLFSKCWVQLPLSLLYYKSTEQTYRQICIRYLTDWMIFTTTINLDCFRKRNERRTTLTKQGGRRNNTYKLATVVAIRNFMSAVLLSKTVIFREVYCNIKMPSCHWTPQAFMPLLKEICNFDFTQGLKSYQPLKFENVYFLSKTRSTFLSWLITFEPL